MPGDATIDELTLFCAARTYSPPEVRALCEDLEWGLNEETQERMGVLTRYLDKKKRRRQTLSAIKACALGLFAIASLILAVGGDLQTAGLGTWAAWLTAGVVTLAFVIAVASSPGDDRYGCLDVETISTLTLIVVGLLGVLWLLGQYLWGRL